MTALRRHEYQDPCVVLEQKQNATCLSCVQLVSSQWGGTRKFVCSTGQQKASIDIYEMRKCRKFTPEVA
jgi:hypothetical protein